MNLEEAKAMIARVDAAEKAGVEFTDEKMKELGFVETEGGTLELPIPVGILRQIETDRHKFVVTDENLDEMEAKFHAMPEDDPDFNALGDALHRWMLG